MKTYYIGYFNKAWSKSDFVILAQTKSETVAGYIESSYNRDYEAAGMSARAVVLEKAQLPEDYRFAD